MTVEYWHYHCELIGYQPQRKPPSASVSSYESPFSRAQNFGEEPALSNDNSPENYERAPQHFKPKGLKRKRKKHNLEVELETTGHKVSGSYVTDTQHNQVEQPSKHHDTQLHDEETENFILDNQKLRLQLLELERSEEELNLKVQQLRSELGDVQNQYTRLLAESESVGKIKEEKNGYG